MLDRSTVFASPPHQGPRETAVVVSAAAVGAVDKSLGQQLDEECPNGVDFFFDNVGGKTLDAAVLERINLFVPLYDIVWDGIITIEETSCVPKKL